jgi:hypothetical protein
LKKRKKKQSNADGPFLFWVFWVCAFFFLLRNVAVPQSTDFYIRVDIIMEAWWDRTCPHLHTQAKISKLMRMRLRTSTVPPSLHNYIYSYIEVSTLWDRNIPQQKKKAQIQKTQKTKTKKGPSALLCFFFIFLECIDSVRPRARPSYTFFECSVSVRPRAGPLPTFFECD